MGYDFSRRAFISAAASTSIAAIGAPTPLLAKPKGGSRVDLMAGASEMAFGPAGRKSVVWAYNASVPGPVLRSDQGSALHVRLKNSLKEPTSVHWHGLRVPISQDGVPYVTQPPIKSGEFFDYRFRTDDAGTFFYHPHINSVEQVGRGLFGALIVDEATRPGFDKDEVLAINDWRINDFGLLDRDFTNFHDRSHAGRYGNLVTVNGKIRPTLKITVNERIRLRLINAATGRIMALRFAGLHPWTIALDGQPVTPRPSTESDLFLGPGMRVDVLLDGPDAAGRKFRIIDRYDQRPYAFAEIEVVRGKPARSRPLSKPKPLPPNPIPRPNLGAADRKEIVFGGGAMGGMMGPGGMMGRGPANMMGMARSGRFWAVNGRFEAPLKDGYEPLFKLKRGRHYVFSMLNQTAFDHPIHFHGHVFQVLTENGRRLREPPFRDSVIMRPRERTDIAFVADIPGDWMFHCHILSHQVSGMMSVVRVG